MTRDSVIISPLLYPDAVGGIELFTALFTRWLVQRGTSRVVVVTLSSTPCMDGAEVFRPAGGKRIRPTWLAAVWRALGSCRGRNACALVPFARRGWVNWSILYLMLRARRVPYVIHVHGGGLYPWKPKTPLRLLFRGAERVLAVSETQVEEYSARSGRPVELLPPMVPFRRSGLSSEEARKSLGIPEGGASVVALGTLSGIKGADTLLDAIDIAFGAGDPGFRVTLFGRDKDRLLEGREFPTGVSWKGQIPFENVPDVFAAADVFVLPSRREGMPMSLLEAAWNGVAPVVTDIPTLEADWSHGVNCLKCPAGDPTALSAALARLAADRPLRERLGAAARETVTSMQDGDSSFRRLASVMDGEEGP